MHTVLKETNIKTTICIRSKAFTTPANVSLLYLLLPLLVLSIAGGQRLGPHQRGEQRRLNTPSPSQGRGALTARKLSSVLAQCKSHSAVNECLTPTLNAADSCPVGYCRKRYCCVCVFHSEVAAVILIYIHQTTQILGTNLTITN